MKIIVAIILILIQVQRAYSADSLNHYLTLAAENNPLVMSKYYEYKATLEKVPQAAGLPDPEFTMGVFLSPMELISGNQVADIQLMQMFPWFGVLRNAKDEMNLMANAKFETFRETKLQVLYEVKNTWYELQMNHEQIKTTESNLVILQTLQRLAVSNLSVNKGTASSIRSTVSNEVRSGKSGGMSGMSSDNTVTETDSEAMSNTSMPTGNTSGFVAVNLVLLEIAQLENRLFNLQDQQLALQTKFNTYLNRNANSPLTMPDSLVPVYDNSALLINMEDQLDSNPMVKMIDYENKSLEAKRIMNQRMGYPMIGFGVNYSVINKQEMSENPMNGEDMIMPMVRITVPIYRKKYKSLVSETDYMIMAKEQSRNEVTNKLIIMYTDARVEIRNAERRISLYEEQLKLLKRNYNILLKAFSDEGSSLSEILNIRRQILDYELLYIEAIAGYNIAVAKIQQLQASE